MEANRRQVGLAALAVAADFWAPVCGVWGAVCRTSSLRDTASGPPDTTTGQYYEHRIMSIVVKHHVYLIGNC